MKIKNENRFSNLMWDFLFICIIVVFHVCVLISVIKLNATTNKNEYYSDLLQITDIDYENNIITFKNSNGFVYIYQHELVDECVGDFYNALILKTGIENNVRDDTIIEIYYERPDLF